MTEHDHSGSEAPARPGFWKSRFGMALIVFLAITGILVAFEHREHILTSDWSLGLLLLVCVGMHLFMHAGHGGHSGGDEK